WAISPYLSDKFHLGAVGYVYNQLTADSGPGARLGEFKSRVAGIGPQIGFFFPIADREGYLNLRGYYEFNASNRLGGWTAYVTFSVEAAEQKSAQPKLPRVTSPPRCPRAGHREFSARRQSLAFALRTARSLVSPATFPV